MSGINRMTRVSIFGAGEIGSHVALLLLERKVVRDICLIDTDGRKAEGQAMDLNQFLSERKSDWDVTFSTDPKKCAGSRICVIAVGRRRMPGELRTDLFSSNSPEVARVAEYIRQYAPESIVIVVTNPLDEMTEVVYRVTKFPPNRVIGMGNSLDTARFREVIHQNTGKPRSAINCFVIGEHGEGMTHIYEHTDQHLENLSRRTAINTIERKGATVFAPASAVVTLIDTIIYDRKNIIPVSFWHADEFKCYGGLVELGSDGIVL